MFLIYYIAGLSPLLIPIFAIRTHHHEYPYQPNDNRRHYITICRLGARRIVDFAPEYDRTDDDPRYRKHRV